MPIGEDGPKATFVVFSRRERDADLGIYYLLITVTAIENIDYLVTYTLGVRRAGQPLSGKLTRSNPTSSRILFYGVPEEKFANPIQWTLVFERPKIPYPMPDTGVKSYIERGTSVTLVGNDGNVSVPKRLLKMRSAAFEAMFDHDTKEKRTGQIELEDFDSKTLTAFSHFLSSGEIQDGKETALGLILLGDKYDIQDMKEVAEKFVKKNYDQMNQEDVLDVFSKVGRESLKQAMASSWKQE